MHVPFVPCLVLSAGQGQADTAALLEHLCQFHCNNFGIVNSLFTPEGAGCYPWGALLNHGCDGNCVLTYAPDPVTRRPQQVIRCIEAVPAGGELVHAYCDAILPVSARQAQLCNDYFFECSCARCTDQHQALAAAAEVDSGGASASASASAASSTSSTSTRTASSTTATVATGQYRAAVLWGLICPGVPAPWCSPAAYRASPASLRDTARLAMRAAMEAIGEPHALPQYGAALGYLLAGGADPLAEPAVVETLNGLVDDSLITQRYDVTAAALTWILTCYRTAYPSSHPMIGLQLFMLGDVMVEVHTAGGTACTDLTSDKEHVMVDWRKKRAAVRREARVALSATHGTDHAMVGMLADSEGYGIAP